MPGPKPKPSELKKLEGNPGKRNLPANEPKISPSIPACPSFVKGEGRKEWKRITPELYRLGLLSEIDRSELAAYCIAWGQLAEVERELSSMRKAYRAFTKLKKKNQSLQASISNGMVRMTSNGNAIMEPLLSVRKQAMEQMHKFLVEFGMTPASRTRISGGPAGKKESKSAMSRLMEATKDLTN